MMRILFSLLSFFIAAGCFGQNFRGQWKGSFNDARSSALSWGGGTCDYVLDLETDGNKISGYSYTYFSSDGVKYYTICRLTGKADKTKKYIEVTEVARTKTNVPDEMGNSFQVHRLRWRKEGDNEILEGTWDPAPGQGRNSGHGTTMLTKRQLTEISALAKRMNAKKDPGAAPALVTPFSKPTTKNIVPLKKPAVNTIVKAKIPAAAIAKAPVKLPVKDPLVKLPLKDTQARIGIVMNPTVIPDHSMPADFEKRLNAVLQTVKVENSTVKIELYDNGEVDGDSISLFYNDKVILAHKKLTEKAIYIDLPVNEDVNELVMYADNLGTIPPNTALMIVYDGNKRYEVRITSDLKKSGTIRFTRGK